jgi:hypothetical protein
MKPSLTTFALAASFAAAGHAAHAQGPASPQRGQLLYETHCVTCHTTQMHWREQRRVRDWESLEAQVRRWQGNASLDWSDEDIRQVARHLNDTIYHLPAADRVGTR